MTEQIYEHPFNERMRLLLRLETVFCQAITHKQGRDQYETGLYFDALFALLNLTKRYELRAELLRELERIKGLLTQFQHADDASESKIEQTLATLNSCADILHALDSKHIDNLRNIEFLNAVKHRNHDSGNFLFELPALQYWLSRPQNDRQAQLQAWLDDFLPFKKAIDFLLQLIRESTEKEKAVAVSGVYIKKVDGRSSNHQLLRILLPDGASVYPRVSGDKYRFAIRFVSQNHIDSRARQSAENIDFTMHLCGI